MSGSRKRPLAGLAAFGVVLLIAASPSAQNEATHELRRAQMVEVIRDHWRHVGTEAVAPEISAAVEAAMRAVPRHEFVPNELRGAAYADRPLPIGYGQAISQPFIVAFMSDLLNVKPGDVVLEIGTGSGYQAAVLAELGTRVYTIEIVPELGLQAGARLSRLRYLGVTTRIGDGYFGWKENAPFDGIVVTAAATHIPPPLVQQLKPGGRMVIPVGSPFLVQQLLLITKNEDGSVQTRQLLPVQFVPITRQRGG